MDRFAKAKQGWKWRTSQAAQAGSGCVDLGGGRFWVDPDNPATVVAAEADDLAGLAELEQALGSRWTETMVQLGPGAATDDPALAPPPLGYGWARLGVVLGVAQWSPQALDESVVAIDEALAWAACGRRAESDALLTLAQDTLAELWLSLQSGGLHPAAHSLLRQAAALLSTSPSADPDVLAILADNTPTEDAPEPAPRSTGAEPDHDRDQHRDGGMLTSRTETSVAVLVDPRFVHPRLLDWRAGTYNVAAAADSTDVVVRAAISDLVPDDAWELRTLYAVLVDSRTGQHLARTPFVSLDLGTAESVLHSEPARPAPDLLVLVANADLTDSPATADLQFDPAEPDPRDAVEQLARWAERRHLDLLADPSPAKDPLLAELVAPPLTFVSANRPHESAELDDALLERVISQWRLDVDLVEALSRDQDPTPTIIDLQHSDATHDSRCTGGQQFLDDLAEHGIHPRITWRYCANPTSLTVLAQRLPGPTGDDVELQLSAGSGWTSFATGDDGYLVAHAQPERGEPVRLRVVETGRP